MTTSPQVPYLADLPTVAEAGATGYEMVLWIALFARGGAGPDRTPKIAEIQR
ncbi:MAG: hypothetical protein GZ089_00250 [Aromatoleum sp.]|nr:hypothetical protein [Aromatoleum sp.]